MMTPPYMYVRCSKVSSTSNEYNNFDVAIADFVKSLKIDHLN